jgi:hypothetical protein
MGRRAWLVVVLVALSAAVLWSPRLAAQALRTHADPICGFSLQYPDSLNAQRQPNGVVSLVTRGFGGFFEQIQDTTAEQAADVATAAAASAARYCLECLREPQDRLVWVDRFREGTTAVRFTISKQTLREFGATVQQDEPGFRLQYFVVADGRARGLLEGSTTRIEPYFWVNATLIRDAEGVAHSIVRSLRFSAPQGQCRV